MNIKALPDAFPIKPAGSRPVKRIWSAVLYHVLMITEDGA